MSNIVVNDRKLNWGELHGGELDKNSIMTCVNDEEWQLFRLSLKGESLDEKFIRLKYWLRSHQGEYCARVQVTNYINALARGGLIEPIGKSGKSNNREG